MRFRLVVALGLHASLAHADAASDAKKAQLVATAEQLENAAKTSNSDADYVKCGQAYLDAYNLDPRAPNMDEMLYNAGVCFESGNSVGIALTMFEKIDKETKSKLRPHAIARMAKLYDRMANYPKAADALERYAAQFAGEKDALQALSDATAIRRALGDDDKAIANTRTFIKSYGAKKPLEAAQAAYGIVDIYSRRNAAERELYLRELLRNFGGKDPELTVRATIDLAESLWKRACPVPGIDGLCIKLDRPRVLPVVPKPVKPTVTAKRCGPAGTNAIVAVARNAQLVGEATKLLQSVQALTNQLPQGPNKYYLARTKLLLADAEFETYAAITFPTNLDFSPDPARKRTKEASLKRFDDFIKSRTKTGGAATASYEATLAIGDATSSIRAAHRLGMVSLSLANELVAAEIPRDVRTGEFAADKIEAFCDKMIEVAEPLQKRAITAFDVCLNKATQLGIRDASSRACARERAALGPTTYPLTAELVPEAPLALPTFDEEPLRKSRALPQPMRDAVEMFWSMYGASKIPDAKCQQLATRFSELGKQGNADAWFMAGMTFGRCQRDMTASAKSAYTSALAIDPKHAKSISNLGELAARAGQLAVARTQWEQAIAIEPKLIAAHLGLATLALRDYRALPPGKRPDPARDQLAKQLELHASTAAALGNRGSPLPYVQLGYFALLDGKLPLARYFAQLAQRIDDAPHTHLLLAAIAKGETAALPHLEAADQGKWQLAETKLALALQLIAIGNYERANKTLGEIKTSSYDVLVARGIVARGLGKVADAEARYQEASKLDPARPEAHFNLGVLFKDHVGARATDGAAAKAAFKKAAEAFRRVGTPEAKLLADDCDKAFAAWP